MEQPILTTPQPTWGIFCAVLKQLWLEDALSDETTAVPNLGFQYSAEYRIFHCSIRLNTNTNSCWTEKVNDNSVLHIVHSALVASSSHTAKYFHSRLRRLAIIHNNYCSIKIREVTQYYSTQTDRRSADYSIDQGVALPPSASCLHGSHVVNVVARHGRGVSWYPYHGMPSTQQWGYCVQC